MRRSTEGENAQFSYCSLQEVHKATVYFSVTIRMKTFAVLACHALLMIQHASAWVTQNVALPLTTEYTTVVNKSIQTSFHEMVRHYIPGFLLS